MKRWTANIHKEIDKESFRGKSDPSLFVTTELQLSKSEDQSMLTEIKNIMGNLFSLVSDKGINIHRFPPHLSPPPGAYTVNFIALATVPAATAEPGLVLWEYTHDTDNILRFTHYAIFNDGLLATATYFKPTINGNRIFQYHGNPMDNFRISLGNAADMNNASLNPVNIELRKGQTISWRVVNTGAVDSDMGVRMVGYIDSSIKRSANRFGG